MRIALVGTRGVPARYGGFETAADEIGRRLVAAGHEVVVYCRDEGGERSADDVEYLGMRLVHLPTLHIRSAETLARTGLATVHLMRRPTDVAIVFNAANAPFLPVLRSRGIPTVLHVDGLEWKRGKWGRIGRRYYIAAEWFAVRWADELIADARAIADYYVERYGVNPTFIPYGSSILQRTGDKCKRLTELGLEPGGYHLVVARFEPENNVDLIIEGYLRSAARLPLVLVGGSAYSKRYVEQIQALASANDNVRLIGSIWDQALLDELYANATTYLHGHSVGGTNPSLLRAMGAATPVIAIDVSFTREVLGPTGQYFRESEELAVLLVRAEENDVDNGLRGGSAQARAMELYNWDAVAADYEDVCLRLCDSR